MIISKTTENRAKEQYTTFNFLKQAVNSKYSFNELLDPRKFYTLRTTLEKYVVKKILVFFICLFFFSCFSLLPLRLLLLFLLVLFYSVIGKHILNFLIVFTI